MRWTANLAYAVGLITADGCLSSDGRHIDLTSKDLLQIQTFAKILQLTNKIGLKSSGSSTKKYYRIEFGNVELYRFLLKIGLTPHKSKTLVRLEIPDRYFIDFLRGEFDGDGCTYSYYDSRWKNSFMLYTAFASGSKIFLEWIQNKINELYGINGKITIHRNSYYQLRYAKNNSVLLLKQIYYQSNIPCLERKRFKINQALDIIAKISRDGGMVDTAD